MGNSPHSDPRVPEIEDSDTDREKVSGVTDTPALRDPRLETVEHEVVRHGPVDSLEEAARIRRLTPSQVLKTLVVRRSEDDYLFILVPGDRSISWPKLRRHLGLNRMTMPDAAEAKAVTGYERGTITPFGSLRGWPVIADSAMSDIVSIGGGAHGVSITMGRDDLIRVLGATRADVTETRD
jgi:Cys-tRNA(Pro)/Cys-tRNA(Cys) deacylase